jgi:predicted unusual protein kinase regulating ubiquinone biosynthesis (AarF/ABC1/UbiB family)
MIITLKRTIQWAQLAILGLLSRKSISKKTESLLKEQLSHNLSQMRGGASKINQALEMMKSTQHDTLKPKTVKPMPLKLIKQILTKNPIFSDILKIHPQAYPASMGQVHKCTLKNGQDLAIKFIYPELLKYLNADQKLINQLFKTFKTESSFNQKSYQTQLWNELKSEIDLLNELKAINELSLKFQEILPHWIFPKAYSKYSTSNILVMEWIEHTPLLEHFPTFKPSQKKAFLDDLANLFLGSLARHGCLHADLNPGNVGLHSTGKYVLIDFGSIWKPKKGENLFLLELLSSIQDNQNPTPVLERIGFNALKIQDIKTQLPDFLKIQLEPFLSPIQLNHKNWQRKSKTDKILPPQNRWDFMTAAPPDYFLFLRAMSGFIFWWKISNTSIKLSEITHNWINRYKHEFTLSKIKNENLEITTINKLKI